ncbi:hypothetical protein NADE_005175 [Nannochloris sp. 'desiccata']|nr:hypothetical protein NADE_005175 [Chlorella desiccata (nom. nud.)]
MDAPQEQKASERTLFALKYIGTMLPSRAIHRSPSHGRTLALANKNEDRVSDPEAGLQAARPGSPKKAEPPTHRRKKPLELMFFILCMTFLLGASLFFSQRRSYSDDRAVSAAAAGGPSIGPEKAWTLLNIRNEAGYGTNSVISGGAYVEFTAPGLLVPLKDALDVNFPLQPEELGLQESPTTTLLFEPQYNRGGGSTSKLNSLKDSFRSVWSEDPLLNSRTNSEGGQGRHLKDNRQQQQQEEGEKWNAQTGQHAQQQQQQQQQHSTLHAAFSNDGFGNPDINWPQPEGVHLLVAVTSACCTQVSLQRRAAIRHTWAALIKERYRDNSAGSISIQFFLAQPENKTLLTEWLPALEEEVVAHNDIVILRGKDTYFNLPNKTFRMFRYTLAHPSEYTHVLKADDDTWVRMHKVLEYLHEKAPPVKRSGGVGGRKNSEEEASAPSAAVIAAAIQRKAELEEMSRKRGVPIVSEGMTLYDASNLVRRVDRDERYAKETVDDIDGSELTLAELARRPHGDAHRASDEMFEEELTEQKQGSFGDSGFVDGGVEGGNGKEEIDVMGGRRRQLQQQRQQLGSSSSFSTRPRMSGIYLGCIENKKGFQPIRDKNNKWYVSEEQLPNESYPHGVKYLAGWGYLLSRDLLMHIVQKVNSYESQPELAPLWYTRIAFEDVLVGLLLHDVVPLPESHSGFRPAWGSCVPDTAVRHLDLDSPRLLKALVEQDMSGLADEKPVQCSSGQFLPGDYAGWYGWRSSIGS